MKQEHKTAAKVGVVVFILMLLVVGYYAGAYKPWGLAPAALAPSPTKAPTGTATSGAELPLEFTVTDPLAGSAVQGATVKVYSAESVLTDTLTTSSSAPLGVCSTSTFWTPGETGYAVVTKSTTNIPECEPFTVPSIATVGSGGQQFYAIPLTDSVIGTYSIKCFDNFGNQYNTNGVLNFTTLGQTSVTLSFTIYNTATNTGWVSTYDKLNDVNQNAAITMYTTGSSVSIPNGISGGSQAQTFPRGTSTYWSAVLSDTSLTNQKIGQTQVLMGQAPFTTTVNKGALVHGTSGEQTFVLTLIAPFDSAYYEANGVGGPNAASLATFTIIFAC